MAFIKRTWFARIGTGLNKFLIGAPDGNGKQTLTSSPDSVTQQGDVISAANLNDLEDRIEAGFNEKQNTLTFDNMPTQGSNNPVKSGGIYSSTATIQEIFTNVSPDQSYAGGTISRAYTGMEKVPVLILIVFRNLKTGYNEEQVVVTTADGTTKTVYGFDVNGLQMRRTYSVTHTGNNLVIVFSNGQVLSNTWVTDNDVYVPVRAIGFTYTTFPFVPFI